MIETIVNITTGACYLVTAGVIVKYIYSRFVQHKNHQGTNIPMVKKQTIVALVENPSLSEDTSSAKGIDKAEYKKRFLGSYMMKNRVQVYIDRSSHECMKRFLSIAAPDTSMAGYVSRIIKTILLKMLRLSIRFLRIVKLNSFSYGSKDIFCSKGLMCLIRILSSVGVLVLP